MGDGKTGVAWTRECRTRCHKCLAGKMSGQPLPPSTEGSPLSPSYLLPRHSRGHAQLPPLSPLSPSADRRRNGCMHADDHGPASPGGDAFASAPRHDRRFPVRDHFPLTHNPNSDLHLFIPPHHPTLIHPSHSQCRSSRASGAPGPSRSSRTPSSVHTLMSTRCVQTSTMFQCDHVVLRSLEAGMLSRAHLHSLFH